MRIPQGSIARSKAIKQLFICVIFCSLAYSAWWYLKWKIFAVPIVRSIAFSPDGRLIAGSGGWLVPHEGDPVQGALWLWNAEDGSMQFRLIASQKDLRVVAFDESGAKVAGWQSDGKKFVWDTTTGQFLDSSGDFPMSEYGSVRETDVLWKGGILPCVSTSSGCRIQTQQNPALTQKIEKAFDSIPITPNEKKELLLAIQDKGNLIATVQDDASQHSEYYEMEHVKIRNLVTGKLQSKFPKKLNPIRLGKFSPDGRSLFLQQSGASDNENPLIWFIGSSRFVVLKNADVTFPLSAVFSPDGRRIVLSGGYGDVQVWDTKSGNSIMKWRAD